MEKGKKLSKWERERSQFFKNRRIEVEDWDRQKREKRVKFMDLERKGKAE